MDLASDGVEFSNAMLGSYAEDPVAFERACQDRDLRVAALAYAQQGFTQRERREEDLQGAMKAVEFCRELGIVLGLAGPASGNAAEPRRELATAVEFYNVVGERAQGEGVTVCVHPPLPRRITGTERGRISSPAGGNRGQRPRVQP